MAEKQNYRRGLKVIQIVCLVILLIGLLYKVLHYQGAGLLLAVGSTGLAATYFIMSFRSMKTSSSLALLYLLVGLCLCVLLFVLMHWDLSRVFSIFVMVLVMVAISLITTRIVRWAKKR